MPTAWARMVLLRGPFRPGALVPIWLGVPGEGPFRGGVGLDRRIGAFPDVGRRLSRLSGDHAWRVASRRAVRRRGLWCLSSQEARGSTALHRARAVPVRPDRRPPTGGPKTKLGWSTSLEGWVTVCGWVATSRACVRLARRPLQRSPHGGVGRPSSALREVVALPGPICGVT
jgi:hypothetical protein